MASVSNHATRPFAIRPKEDNMYNYKHASKVLFQFGCPRTSRRQLSFISFCEFSFISFCQFRRKLVPRRVTRRTRIQAICFITRRQWSPLIDVSTIVSSSSTRTFPLASLAGIVQPLTSCFKLFLFFVIFAELSKSSNREMSGKGNSARPSMLRPEGKATPSPLVLFFFFIFVQK